MRQSGLLLQQITPQLRVTLSKKKLNLFLALLTLGCITTVGMVFLYNATSVLAATSTINLLSADNFAVLAGSAISDTGTSIIIGDVGLSPAGGSFITGVTCPEVTGTIYDTNGGYTGGGGGSTACLVTNAGLLTTAKANLTTAYNDAAGRTTTQTIATELSGAHLFDGVYDSAAGTFAIAGAGTLTLDAQGDPDAVFIFKMASTLITGSSSHVALINGAQACNVFWQVGSSATLETSSDFIGTVLASASITDNGSSTVAGRLLALNAAVTLNNSTVIKPTCATPSPSPTATVSPTPTPTPTPTIIASSTNNSAANSASNGGNSGTVGEALGTIVIPVILDSRRNDANSVFLNWGPDAGVSTFNVQYGLINGEWIYNTNVSGFSTFINALPTNQPIWVRVAARNDSTIGEYSEPRLVGGPSLPNTGYAP